MAWKKKVAVTMASPPWSTPGSSTRRRGSPTPPPPAAGAISQRHYHRQIQTENRRPCPFVRRNFGADHLAHIENLVLVQAGGIVHVAVRSREVESANPILSRGGPSLMATRRARMVEYSVNFRAVNNPRGRGPLGRCL